MGYQVFLVVGGSDDGKEEVGGRQGMLDVDTFETSIWRPQSPIRENNRAHNGKVKKEHYK